MNYLNKKTVEDIDVAGKRVLVRCDFNVPMKDGAITDTKRIVGALPTVKYLSDHGAKVILCSHMGRPHNIFNDTVKLDKKEKKKIDAMPQAEQAEATAKALEAAKGDVTKFSLAPVAAELGKLLGKDVAMAKDVIGPDAKAKAAALKDGDVMIIENIRFHAEETKNDPAFAKELASMAEIYVNDAFGTAHRAHASTEGVSHYLPAVCGYLIQKEITVMGGALTEPKRPFVAILGGAKVSDKIGVIDNLISKVDTLIIGGGMAYTFFKAQGYGIGTSLCEEDKLELAKATLEKAQKNGVKFLLPVDTKVGKEFDPDTESQVVDSTSIPEGWMGLDIGPKTIELFSEAIKGAATVVWNGPMGVSEWDNFAKGTIGVASAVAESGAISIIGGGDSAAAVEKLGFADKMTHISTGGGASLEFLEGLELPGIACLNEK
ncbi:MAG: phosphoglycerate kinase [Acutalibacter sp.]|nr:phosphoglycerate kinase [Acutalibacter sp.]